MMTTYDEQRVWRVVTTGDGIAGGDISAAIHRYTGAKVQTVRDMPADAQQPHADCKPSPMTMEQRMNRLELAVAKASGASKATNALAGSLHGRMAVVEAKIDLLLVKLEECGVR